MSAPWAEEPVRCPSCGAGPGRQCPGYAGHGEGAPWATGAFRCEVCGTGYRPGQAWEQPALLLVEPGHPGHGETS